MEMTNPEDLLPDDQFILRVDPKEIMKASPDAMQAWLANFETAEAMQLSMTNETETNLKLRAMKMMMSHNHIVPGKTCLP